ncbi:MAG: hypothetical protein ACOVO1_09475 [Chitinophagaceae bacterium]
MHFKLKLLFVATCLLICNALLAQDEERYNKQDSSESFSEPIGAIHFLKLKKSYSFGDGITLRSTNGNFNVSQSLQTLYTFSSAFKNLSNATSGFNIARARLTLVSNLFDKKLSTVMRVNLPANYQSTTTGVRTFNTTLQEAYIEYRPNRKHVFNIGLRADYIDSRETRIEGESLGFVDRSAVSASFDAIFDYGIRYKGNYKLGGNHLLKPYASITTGDSRSALQKNFGGFKYGIRLDYLPFGAFTSGGEFYMDDLQRERKAKLVIGVIASYNDGASSASGTNGGRFIYADTLQQNILLPKYTKLGVDYLFKYKGFYSMGSLFTTQATVPDNIKGEYRLNGTFNTYSTAQTAAQTTNIVLSRLNLGTGLNMQAGYVFPSDFAVGFRFTNLNSNTISANFADYNKFYDLVFSKYLANHNCKIQFQISFDELQNALKTTTQNGIYYTQLMFTVQL